jgi:hypothetical protein
MRHRPMRHRPPRHRRTLLLLALGTVACRGPALHVSNPDGHPVFVDGVRLPAATDGTHTLPYRYYGTTRWDAVPKDLDGDADWDHQPASAKVTVAPPAPPLLFPLDLPIELLGWLLQGQSPTTAAVTLPRTSQAELAATAQGNSQLNAVRQRAQEARIRR